ncbi:hypothetical protein [Duffyella gerundensis]|uniref:hypothetical protein n=1 Tax=Duffyella gerundensis TaxID=1619313 RepID=UPI0012FE9B19|nr:hypothetical protein [Duffyella gerundensis]
MFTSSAVVMPPQRQNPGQNQNTKTPKHQNTKTPKHQNIRHFKSTSKALQKHFKSTSKALQKHFKSTSDLGYKP